MIKLALLIPTLDRSGAEKQLTLLAAGLSRTEFDVRVVCLTRGGPYQEVLEAAGIPVTVLGKRLKFDPGTLWKLKSWLRREQPDLLHTWLFAANAYGRLCSGASPKTRVIVSERCVDSWKSGWQLWLDRKLAARTRAMIANSRSVADFYQSHGFPAERLTVIPNGIALPMPSSEDTAALRAELQLAPGTRVVGSVGRLAKQKRMKDLVWAFQLLRQITENVACVVVGDGPERAALEKLARHFDCLHLMRFVGHRQDAIRFFPLFDVFWLNSDFEGMSNSLMEAMAHSVPAVCSDIPPNRELAIDGQTAYFVKPGDSVGFAQFTDRLLADPDVRTRMGEASRQRIATEFSIEKMIASHVALYGRVLASPING